MKENIMIIPNNNNLLEKELKNNPKKYFDNVFDCFISEIKKDLIPDNIKLFKFEKTELQVIVKREHYMANLENILDYYIKQEEYEKCDKLAKLKSILNKEE